MPLIETPIADLFIFEPKIFKDERGYFFESFNARVFEEHHLPFKFVQDNQAKSTYGVIRGLHFQKPPFAQTKLIRVLQGKIWDVVVDIRTDSPTFGQHYCIELSEENQRQLLVPKGFAHGYAVLEEDTVVFYKCDEFYHKEAEGGIYYNDEHLKIDWRIPPEKVLLSSKDQLYPQLQDFTSPF